MRRERLSILMKPNHAINNFRLGMTAIVTAAKSYDVFIGVVVLYSMGFQMDDWTENAAY